MIMKENYFLLIDEKLNPVRRISQSELASHWNLKQKSLGKIKVNLYHGKKAFGYTVIEDYEDDPKEETAFQWHKFHEGAHFNYYVGSGGCFIRKRKSTNKSERIAVYKKRKHFMVKIANKEMDASRIYVEHFVLNRKLDTFSDIVICESDNFDINMINIYTRSEYYKMKSTNKKIGYYEKGKLKRVFDSSREAARALYTNRQTVLDTCNGKYGNMWGMDLRYIDNK